MDVISFFDSDRQEHWLEELGKSDWAPGAFLCSLISSGRFFDAVGKSSMVLLLTDGDDLISYCTFAEKDDIQPTDLSPWMGFVYTFPAYRGNRHVGKLFEAIEQLAGKAHVSEIYISTNHSGLYEKYGCEYRTDMIDIEGNPSRVYVKTIRASTD